MKWERKRGRKEKKGIKGDGVRQEITKWRVRERK